MDGRRRTESKVTTCTTVCSVALTGWTVLVTTCNVLEFSGLPVFCYQGPLRILSYDVVSALPLYRACIWLHVLSLLTMPPSIVFWGTLSPIHLFIRINTGSTSPSHFRLRLLRGIWPTLSSIHACSNSFLELISRHRHSSGCSVDAQNTSCKLYIIPKRF